MCRHMHIRTFIRTCFIHVAAPQDGRFETGTFFIYTSQSSTTSPLYTWKFNTASRTWASSPTPRSTSIVPDTQVKGACLVPCDPSVQGVCDGTELAPTPSPSPSPSPIGVLVGGVPAWHPTSLLALRVGDGSAPLTTAAAALFIDELDPVTGARISSIPLPTAVAGSNYRCTLPGINSNPSALMSRSTDGRFVHGESEVCCCL